MLSEVIHTRHSYPAVLLAEQPVHQRSVHFGPLVLEANFLKNQRLQQIGDQPVSRMIPTITRCIGLELDRESCNTNRVTRYESLTFSLYGYDGFDHKLH